MFNFTNKLTTHNDTLIALAPAVTTLGVIYCWVVSMGFAMSGLGMI